MRFPRLAHLFHRRVKSDGALAVLPPVPMATPASRPVSMTYIDELIEHPSDVFAPFVTAIPLSIPTHSRAPATLSQPIVPHLPSPYGVSRARSEPPQPDHTVLMALAERNRELDTALQRQYDVNRRIPALEAALSTERTALRTARDTITELSASVVALQADLGHAQAVLEHQANSDHARVLAAENTALTAERLRHRKFIELMIAVGGHKPVLDRAYQSLAAGADPEAALVAAIKDALTRPDSAWATLLQPVIGMRSPDEYLAQVQISLRARKELRDWRKRAKFWKRAAKEFGEHTATVTPSPSDISSIVEVLPPERQETANALLEGVRNGTRLLRVNRQSKLIDIVPSTSSPEPVVAESEPMPPARPLSTVLPTSNTTSTVRLSVSYSSAHVNLAPLASQTFRASNSILRAASRRSSVASSLSRSVSGSAFGLAYILASSSGVGSEFKTRRESITPSISASTEASTASAKSRRRKAHIVAIDQPRVPEVPEQEEEEEEEEEEEKAPSILTEEQAPVSVPTSAAPSEDAPPRPVTPPASASSSSNSGSGSSCATPTATISTPGSADQDSTPTAPTSTVSACSSATIASSASRTLTPTPQRKGQLLNAAGADTDGSHTDEDSEELIIVMHSDLAGAKSPEPATRMPSPSAIRTQTPTPEKKSRLPMPVLRNFKAIRRLSISKPVLVDTTNAATFTFSTKAAGKLSPSKHAEGKVADNHRPESPREKAMVMAGSPPRPSKIPMGLRIQQLHGDLVGNARRALLARRTNGQA